VATKALRYLANVDLIPTLVVKGKIDSKIEIDIVNADCQFGVLASYGMIIPDKIIDLFSKGILNIHPSLLPILRGPSPVKSAILDNLKETGVSIMLLDRELDHGPIIAQGKIGLSPQKANSDELRDALLKKGASLLKDILPLWLDGRQKVVEQEHVKATYTRKFIAEDGLLDVRSLFGQVPLKEVLEAERKVRALNPEPGTYMMLLVTNESGELKKLRVKILKATTDGIKLVPLIVQPEGKKQMEWASFLRGNKLTAF